MRDKKVEKNSTAELFFIFIILILRLAFFGEARSRNRLKRITVWQKQVYRKTQVQVNQIMESHSVESEFRITEMQSLLYFHRNNQLELSPRPFS